MGYMAVPSNGNCMPLAFILGRSAGPSSIWWFTCLDGSLEATALKVVVQLEAGGVAVVASNGKSYYNLFIKEDGSLWAFGDNTFGQLEDGTTVNRDEPIQIVSSNVVLASVVGPYQNGSSFFIKTDGSLWAMGKNQQGQLGDGTSQDKHSPVKIVDDGVITVSAGSSHSMFLSQMAPSGQWGIICMINLVMAPHRVVILLSRW